MTKPVTAMTSAEWTACDLNSDDFERVTSAIEQREELLSGLKWLLASGVRHKSFCPAAEKRGECDCGLYRNVELPIAKAEGKAHV